MQTLRALVHRYRLLAVMLVALALAIKALVPAGYMLHQRGTVITVEICADASGATLKQQIVIPPADSGGGASETPAKAFATCPYAALSFAALAAADAVLLAAALAFILALGFLPTSLPAPRRIAFLRPPLRGPPAFA